MDTSTPAQLAADAAEAVRALNHATLDAPPRLGWEFPSDAYSTVAGLSLAAMTMPQAFDQIGALIEALDGSLTSSKGPVDDDVIAVYAALADATDAARTLHQALTRAHSALSPLGCQD
jgi:hypothetical protein